MKRFFIYLLLGFSAQMAMAQANTFKVHNFRLLPNDISAYVDPVRDLNKEACALIKVVGDRDFEFSTPLGIVQRRNETGEIWIYVPKGTGRITIKHPRWGILRDFRFPELLESRLTYELTLKPPLDPTSAMTRHLRVGVRLRPLSSPTKLPSGLPVPERRVKRPKLPLSRVIMLNAGISESTPAVGLSVAIMRRHGAYFRALTNLRTITTQYDAVRDGTLAGETTKPYYTGKVRRSHHTVTIGGIHRLTNALYLYEGIGYGKHLQAWETTEDKWVRITDYSYSGFSGEAGGMWKHRRWAASLGVLTIKASYWELVAGIGFNF